MTMLINRSTAKEYGLTHYFTGKPCVRGHVARRMTDSGGCMECRGENQTARRQADPERDNAYQRTYREKHKEQVRDTQKAWIAANPQQVKDIRRANRARRRSAEGTHTAEELRALFVCQGGKCGNCKRNLKRAYHADHIMPLALGGTNWIKNIQLLCPSCNAKKSALHPLEWAKRQGKLV